MLPENSDPVFYLFLIIVFVFMWSEHSDPVFHLFVIIVFVFVWPEHSDRVVHLFVIIVFVFVWPEHFDTIVYLFCNNNVRFFIQCPKTCFITQYSLLQVSFSEPFRKMFHQLICISCHLRVEIILTVA